MYELVLKFNEYVPENYNMTYHNKIINYLILTVYMSEAKHLDSIAVAFALIWLGFSLPYRLLRAAAFALFELVARREKRIGCIYNHLSPPAPSSPAGTSSSPASSPRWFWQAGQGGSGHAGQGGSTTDGGVGSAGGGVGSAGGAGTAVPYVTLGFEIRS